MRNVFVKQLAQNMFYLQKIEMVCELFQWIKRCLKKFGQMCLHEFLQWKDFEVLVFLCGIQCWPELECV
jgi:hypothetical protein